MYMQWRFRECSLPLAVFSHSLLSLSGAICCSCLESESVQRGDAHPIVFTRAQIFPILLAPDEWGGPCHYAMSQNLSWCFCCELPLHTIFEAYWAFQLERRTCFSFWTYLVSITASLLCCLNYRLSSDIGTKSLIDFIRKHHSFSTFHRFARDCCNPLP